MNNVEHKTSLHLSGIPINIVLVSCSVAGGAGIFMVAEAGSTLVVAVKAIILTLLLEFLLAIKLVSIQVLGRLL